MRYVTALLAAALSAALSAAQSHAYLYTSAGGNVTSKEGAEPEPAGDQLDADDEGDSASFAVTTTLMGHHSVIRLTWVIRKFISKTAVTLTEYVRTSRERSIISDLP
ncbi:uncharacterized protein LOC114251974 [Bombyx mandarina]|uniref:Uncharacterized protein LOC114251974 n=1 Tax=Bombyx mandarina TaxID=7092 RepID=A0A6J2KJH5_BOMMA|nr:uncharacterized protein LOC114251974 [Bombyx mandarina]